MPSAAAMASSCQPTFQKLHAHHDAQAALVRRLLWTRGSGYGRCDAAGGGAEALALPPTHFLPAQHNPFSHPCNQGGWPFHACLCIAAVGGQDAQRLAAVVVDDTFYIQGS